MTPAPVPQETTDAKRRVALHSMLAAAAMTLIKLCAGILSGSIGVLSDSAHSGLDLVGAALTFFSVQVSDKPADEDHTYGHGKFENISSVGEVLLMAASSIWLIYEAVERMLHRSVTIHGILIPALVVLASISVDWWRSRKLAAVAKATGSPALATDAFHFASDIWSSLAVLIGLALSWLGTLIHQPVLSYADPVAAIVVSLMILRLTVHLGREAVDVLLDRIPKETRRQILVAVEELPGVLSVDQVRVRRSGPAYFADLTLGLPSRTTFERTGEISDSARAAVQRILPGADVMIHPMPRQSRAESIFDRVRAVAARHNVSVHELSVQAHKGKLRVEQHLELDENLSLHEAHNFVTAMEIEILKRVPEVDAVLTHIESEQETIEPSGEIVEADRRIEVAMIDAAASLPELVDVHEIAVIRSKERISLTCHCTLPDEMPMRQVHAAITEFENLVKKRCPEVDRVTIHPEPATDNLR